jgi:hypothetical protein
MPPSLPLSKGSIRRWGSSDVNPTTLPPHVQAEAQRILDAAARRLLADQMDRDAPGAPARRDGGTVDGGSDQVATLAEGEAVPIVGRVDRDRGTEAA